MVAERYIVQWLVGKSLKSVPCVKNVDMWRMFKSDLNLHHVYCNTV